VSDTDKAMEMLKAEGYTARLSDVMVVRVPDKPNGLADILHVLEEEDISVEYLYSFVRNTGFDAMLICKVSEIDKAEEALKATGISVLDQEQISKL